MSRNPASILFDSSGKQLAVTASVALPAGTTGLVLAGVDPTGSVHFASFDQDALKVSGSFGIDNQIRVTSTGSLAVTGSVGINNQVTITSTGSLGITGSVNINNQLTITSTGSLGVLVQNPVTSVTVTSTGSLGITGSVGINNQVTITATGSIGTAVQNQVTVTSTGSLGVAVQNQIAVTSTGSLAITGSVNVNNQLTITSTGSLGVSVQNQIAVTSTGSLGVTLPSEVAINTNVDEAVYPTHVLAIGGLYHSGSFPPNYGHKLVPLRVDSFGRQIVSLVDYSSTIFGQTRVATPFKLFDSEFGYEIDTNDYGTSSSTGGTITYISSSNFVRLTATTTSASYAGIRTHTFFKYQSGCQQTVKVTGFSSDKGVSGITKRLGYFNENNGFFIEMSGSDINLGLRSNTSGIPVTTYVSQSSWNVDRMDGNGHSGVTLDITKDSIFEWHIAWLSAGPTKFYINENLAHIFQTQNVNSGPYMRTANLPITAEIFSTGSVSSSSFNYICASVQSEGGSSRAQNTFSIDKPVETTISPSGKPILSIRLKSTYGGSTNRMVVLPSDLRFPNSYKYFNDKIDL